MFPSHCEHVIIEEEHSDADAELHKSGKPESFDCYRLGIFLQKVINNPHFCINSNGV